MNTSSPRPAASGSKLPGGGAGAVSVTFEDAGDVGDATLVRLEHTGWEAYGDRAAAARTEYGHGWPVVLDAYAASVVGT